MAKKRRARKRAKNIQKQPKLRKMMAEFLGAQHVKNIDAEQIKEMLVMGHRGYLAMSEAKLTKLFDQHYDHLCSELEKAEKMGDNTGWGEGSKENRVKNAKSNLMSAEAIYDAVFEDTFL